ncbi:MAG: hypothetical protein GY906_13440 [bacterium]|nr:hypothetical protein [bacterium]
MIRRCLATDPSDRYRSAMDVVAALETASGSVSVSALRQTATIATDRLSQRRSVRFALWLIAGAAVVVGATAIYRTMDGSRIQSVSLAATTPAQLTTWAGLEIDPAFSPSGGAITYSANRSGDFEIYLLQLTPGSREIQLTADGSQNFQPAWSPDGQWIAYYSQERGGIWVVPSFGGAPRRLVEFGSHPAWSPDGQWLAFQSDATAELAANANHAMPPSTLWLVPAFGGTPQRLTSGGEPRGGHGAPQWSPDGTRLVFATCDRRWSEIWTINRDGSDLKPIVTDRLAAFDPMYSPTGERIFFSAVSEGERYGVWSLAIDPRTHEGVGEATSVANLGMASIRRFSLSRDGSSMVHTALATVSNIWSLALDLETFTPIGDPQPLTSGSGRNSRPAFSPDGGSIALDRWRVGADQDIWLMDRDGGGLRQITVDPATDTQPSWFPDSHSVVYASDRQGESTLWATDLESGKRRLVARVEPTVDSIRVSPDGTHIAYHTAAHDGTINLWLANIDGGNAHQITFDKELMGFPSWSPDGRFLAFEMRRGDTDQVMVLAIDENSDPQQLTATEGRSWPYSWAPDNDKVAYAGLVGQTWDLYWVSRSTGEQVQLTHFDEVNGYVRYPSWSPLGNQIVFERAETTGDLWLVEGLQTIGEN